MKKNNSNNKMEVFEEDIEEGEIITPHKKSIFKEKIESFGLASLGLGFLGTSLFFHVFRIIIQALVIIGFFGWAYGLFQAGSILLALLVLFIGMPIALGIVYWFFPYLFILSVLSGIIWIILFILGFNISFSDIFSNLWSLITILLALGVGIFISSGIILSVREKRGKQYIKENFIFIIFAIVVAYFILPNTVSNFGISNTNDTLNIVEQYEQISPELKKDLQDLENLFKVAAEQKSIRTGMFENLNLVEKKAYQPILESLSNNEKLSEENLDDFRNIINSYTKRTNAKIKDYEHEAFRLTMKFMNNYESELAKSALESWNHEQYFVTNDFESLYDIILELGIREYELMEYDISIIKAAGNHQNYLEDEYGEQDEFSRDIILEKIDEVEVEKNNADKMAKILLEFTE